MMRCGLFGIGGVFTPLDGCRKVTWSFNAVVKIALRTTMQYLMACGLTPSRVSLVTHSRTCAGRISTIRIGPNSGMIRRSR
jgi:hypothetical protein